MPFGRTGRQNNRSQHAFDQAPAAASGPGSSSAASAANTQAHPSASPNPAFSSSESFDTAQQQHQHQQQQQQQQQQLHLQHQQQQQHPPPPPPPHTVPVFASSNIGGGAGNPSNNPPPHLLASNTTPQPAFGGRSPQPQPQPLDFAEQVSRSQSQRYPQVTPLQAQHPFAPASTSVDNLNNTLHASVSPLAGHVQPIPPHQPPIPVPESRKSTRKLIKNLKSNFLSGSSSTSHRASEPHQQHTHQNSYDNTAGLARRPSKRVSQPPTIRTGVSQVSLEQPLDWQAQSQLTQPSPLQGVGEFADRYTIQESNQDLLVQDPLAHPQNTLRRVPTDHETSPYGPDEIGAGHRQQAYLNLQGQASPENQQNPYGQVQYDNSPQQYQYQSPQQPQLQYQGGTPQVLTGHLNTNLHQQNPETVSQLSHESPVTDTDQHSAQNLQSSQTSPAVNYPLQSQAQSLDSSDPALGQPQLQQNMPPPTGQSSIRRSQEAEKNMRGQGQVEPPPGPPPGYRHSQAPNMNPLPPPPQQGGAQNPGNYRSNTVTDRQFEGNPPDGRNSPQPSASDRDALAAAAAADPDKSLKELVVKYKNVKRLYFDGKAQIDQLSGQVETLQNAVANQRMSQSRTSLDDNEYTTRFNRLNGAINNLSFNIRKDWVTLPSWLDKYVSPDALKTGKQEMTAVGRAVISRWVHEEIFNHCFHPGLDPDLSRQLKEIERNIRKFSYKMNSQEEYEALTSKVVNWRMATLEGLQAVLNSSESADHRADFTQRAATNLTASLFQHLTDPPPPGVDGSASMIVELAVGIAFHLPMESRDVAIIYPMPLENIVPHIMEVEKTGLPALENRPSDGSELDDQEGEEGGKEDTGKGGKDRKSRSGMSSKVSGGLVSLPGRKGSNAASSHVPSATSSTDALTTALPLKDSGKIRFAGFVAVDVRGRHVLIKAPVWTLS